MARWEHARLFVFGEAGDVYVQYGDAGIGPRKLGQAGPGVPRREDALRCAIAELGAGGWEPVSVVYTPEYGGRLTYSFKRRVDDDA